MPTPSARFVIGFDADTSGIDQSKSSLDSLRASIERDTKALTEMSAAMQRLRGTAEVVRWEALPKDIGRAESEVAKFAARFAKLKADFDAAPAGKKEGIFAKALENQGELNRATARLAALKAEKDKLSKSEPVRLFEDLKAGAEKLKQGLGQSQTAFSRLGGTMASGSKEASSATAAMKDLAAGADAAGHPVGGLVSKFSALKALGPAGIIAAVVVAVVAVAAVFASAVAKATAFAISMSDGARSARLLREASAGSAAAADGLYQATLRIEDKTDAQRESVVGLVNEYARLKLSLGAIEGAASAVSIATQTMGAQAGSTIKGLIDRGVDTKRFWLNALDLKGTGTTLRGVATTLAKQMKIGVGAAEAALRQGRIKLEDGIKALGETFEESDLGKIAKKQLLALPVQFERAKKNIANLFSGVAIEPFLEKLSGVLDLFKETSDTGKALKQALGAVFQSFADSATDALPVVETMIWETTIAIQDMVIAFLKAGGAKAFFTDAKKSAEDLWSTLKTIASVLETIGKGISFAKDAASLFVVKKGDAPWTKLQERAQADVDAKALSGLGNGFRQMSGKEATDAGLALTAGVAAGITEGTPGAVKSISALADALRVAFDTKIERHSPSRLFRRSGRDIPRGVEQGVDDEKPRVARALSSLADPADLNAAGVGAAIAKGSAIEDRSISLVVHYQGGGTRNDARRFGQWLVDELETLTLAKGLPVR